MGSPFPAVHTDDPLYFETKWRYSRNVAIDRPLGQSRDKIWIKNNAHLCFTPHPSTQGHEKIITCLDGYTQAGGTEQIVSGGYDNKVKLWALPSGALVAQCDIAVTPSTLAMDDAAVYVGGPDGYLVKLQVS